MVAFTGERFEERDEVMATRTASLSEEDLPTQLRLIGKRIRFAGSPSVPRRVSAQSRPLVVGDVIDAERTRGGSVGSGCRIPRWRETLPAARRR